MGNINSSGPSMPTPNTVIVVVPCATTPRYLHVEDASPERLGEIKVLMNTALTMWDTAINTQIPDLRAIPAALTLRNALMESGLNVVLLVNERLLEDADNTRRYSGGEDFAARVQASILAATRTRRLAGVIEVHSFATRGRPGDVLPAGENPPRNYYFFSGTRGRNAAPPGTVHRFAREDQTLLTWASTHEEVTAPYVVYEFYQHIYYYQVERLWRDALEIARCFLPAKQ